MCVGHLRFKQLQRELPGISGKVLSGELKELETNEIVERKIYDMYPITVEYSLTPYGKTLEPVVSALRE
jgi:DNA-binding HxlR family transcriptional regulator